MRKCQFAFSHSSRKLLRPWQTRAHYCGQIVAHDVSSGRKRAQQKMNFVCFRAAQTGKHLLRTQNVSEQNQKHLFCLGYKICARNKCCEPRQTGKHLCRQQCVFVGQPLGLACAIHQCASLTIFTKNEARKTETGLFLNRPKFDSFDKSDLFSHLIGF